MEALPVQQISLSDTFWTPRLETNARRAIFHQWRQLEASGCIDNFRIAAGEKEGLHQGWFFADSDATKWLDAAARIYRQEANPQLGVLMDEFITLLGHAQAPDGYLFTYNQINFPGTRWKNLQIEHELYCHGHLIEAGVSHYETTGRTDMLAIARRAADLLVHDFLDTQSSHTPGHEEIEIALIRLYQASEYLPYLELARHFLEQRGRAPFFALDLLRQNASYNRRSKWVRRQKENYQAAHPAQPTFQLPAANFAKQPPGITLRYYASVLSGKFFQQHAPIRQQTVPVGHAVRFGYLETAVAMLHRARPDVTLLPALEQAWEHMVTRRMYLTGGIGSLPEVEGFGNDYELDPKYAYAETCAALACLLWNWEMALITRSARFSDLFEWQLYNAAAVGIGLDGESYFYNNPLDCRGGFARQAWYAVPCCPSNLARTWADLGKYIYSVEKNALWIHQYIGSQAQCDPGLPLQVEMVSNLPFTGEVAIRLEPKPASEFTLHLRFPSWSAAPRINLNGTALDIPLAAPVFEPTAQGFDPRQAQFLPIRRVWSAGDVVRISFDLPIVLRRAHPKVKAHQKKAALTRGPLLYCLENVDNPSVDIFACRLEPSSLKAEFDGNVLGGIWVLRGEDTSGKPLTFIPYHLWGNRGESQMTVWVNV